MVQPKMLIVAELRSPVLNHQIRDLPGAICTRCLPGKGEFGSLSRALPLGMFSGFSALDGEVF